MIIAISFLCKVPHVTATGPQKRSFPGQRALASNKAFINIRGLHQQRRRPFILSAKGCNIRLLLGTLIRPSTGRALYRTTSAPKWNISVFGLIRGYCVIQSSPTDDRSRLIPMTGQYFYRVRSENYICACVMLYIGLARQCMFFSNKITFGNFFRIYHITVPCTTVTSHY